jgi:flagellin-like protein
LSPQPEPDRAGSPIIGSILIIAIIIIGAMLLLLMCLGFQMPQGDPTVPVVFRINTISYIADSDGIHYRGFVTVTNTESKNYRNRYLKVVTYVNGNNANCNIPTLNNNLFCTTGHDGVWHLWGVGTHGSPDSSISVWPAGSDISIEYTKGRLHPGDHVTLEFIDTTTSQIISRDTWPHSDIHNAQWFYNNFLSHQAS